MRIVVNLFLLVSFYFLLKVAVSRDQRGRNIQPDALQPVTSSILESKLRAHDQHRITRQDLSTGDHNSRSGERTVCIRGISVSHMLKKPKRNKSGKSGCGGVLVH